MPLGFKHRSKQPGLPCLAQEAVIIHGAGASPLQFLKDKSKVCGAGRLERGAKGIVKQCGFKKDERTPVAGVKVNESFTHLRTALLSDLY
jgi:hypothetical protein